MVEKFDYVKCIDVLKDNSLMLFDPLKQMELRAAGTVVMANHRGTQQKVGTSTPIFYIYT